MRSFNKEQKKQVSDACDVLEAASKTLEEAINKYNETVGPLRDDVQGALDAYNEKLEELKGIYEEIGSEARDYYDDRSEKWQEGDAGQAYSEWADALESPDSLDPVELELPEDVEFPDDIPDWTDTSFLPPEEPGM